MRIETRKDFWDPVERKTRQKRAGMHIEEAVGASIEG